MISLNGYSDKLFAEPNPAFSARLDIEKTLASIPSGTQARDENEFKLTVSASAEILKKNSYIIQSVKGALERSFHNDLLWKAQKFTGSNYSVMETGLGTFCYFDIYLDTADNFNYKNNISYRVRYRWRSRPALFRYLSGGRNPVDLPHRCEYQLKVYGKVWANGFNDCKETRFEFRNESKPFKEKQSAPLTPWPFEEFVRPAVSGKYKNYCVITAHELAQKLRQNYGLTERIELKPSLVIVTTRRRIHLGLKNDFGQKSADQGLGSAQNSEQAILITLDTSEAYEANLLDTYQFAKLAKSRNSLSKRLVKRLKAMLQPVKVFTELEFEFERNIESSLSLEIENTLSIQEKQKLEQMKGAFLDDVKTTAKIVASTLSELGIKTEPGKFSKYRQAGEGLLK